jgi:hypothetical protein
MPTINRFRVVNFKYDNDKKFIANELFTFSGKNALLNLENGGGKSVILQLALQVLLPNAELSNRKFVDYFKINSGTAHILIEWLLDSTTREYLLTGICASRDSEGLRFFTYTHAYLSPNECDIKSIPVLNSKKQVTGYSEFYKFLRGSTTQFRINTYAKDRMRDYREKLATHNLFENEFEAIRIINQSEGGIEKFFERARKSRNVIERLIIPAIPSLVGEEQGLLADTFKKHLENLKSIPILQHNMNIYQSFLERGTELLNRLREHDNTAKSCTDFKHEILVLENLVHAVEGRLKAELENYLEERRELEAGEALMNYKKDSLEVHIEKKKRLELEQTLHSQRNALEVETIRLTSSRNKIKYMNAGNSYIDLKEQRKRYLQLKEKLQVLSMQEGEIEKEYQECLLYLSKLLTNEITKLKILIREQIDSGSELKQKVIFAKEEFSKTLKLKETVSNDLAVKKWDKELLTKRQSKHVARFSMRDMTLLLEPSVSLVSFEKTKEKLEKSKLEFEEQLRLLSRQEENGRIKLGNIALERSTLGERYKNRLEKKQEFEKKHEALKVKVEALGLGGDLYNGTLEEKLAAIGAKTAAALSMAQIGFNAIENKKLLLEGLDYFLPDRDVLNIYKFLQENGVSCITGALWLQNQPEDRREELLRKNPLLPCAIVVEASEFKRVTELSESMSKLARDYPVAIIAGNGLGINYVSEKEANENFKTKNNSYLDNLSGSQIFLLRSDNSRLLLNKEEFSAYFENLGKRLSDSHIEIEVLRQDQEKILSLKQKVSEFLKEYSQDIKNMLQVEIDKLMQSIETLGKEALKLDCEQEDIKKRKLQIEKEAENNISEIQETIVDITEMQELIKTEAELKECGLNIGKLESEQKSLEKVIDGHEIQIEGLIEKLNKTENRAGELARALENLTLKLSDVKKKLNIENSAGTLTCSIEEIEARIKAIESKLSTVEKSGILDNMKSMEENMSRSEKDLKKLGFEEIEFEGIYEKIPDAEITKVEETEKTADKFVREIDLNCRDIDGQIKTLHGGIEILDKGIYKKYEKEAFEFDAGNYIELKYFEDQIKEYRRKILKIAIKISEAGIRRGELEKNLSAIEAFIDDRKISLPNELRVELLQLKGFNESIELWDMMKMKGPDMAVLIRKYKEEYDRVTDQVTVSQKAVEECFDSLYNNDAWKDNATLKRILSGIMKENLFNNQYMNTLFESLFESVKRMREAESLQLEECKRNKGELVERCLQRAQAVYDEVALVDSFSKIKINGENLKIIKIEMPKLEEEKGRAMTALYLENCIEEIGRLKDEGSYDPAKIENMIIGYMAPQMLLDAVISLNDISIKVYKPEHNIELSQYIPWEVVIQWSGGEKLAGFFAMFISIVSYLRYKRTGWQGSTKVIWIDNPFGQANAGHLLEFIFELARATNTQMICLTGLQETNIYAQFEVVYSLVHRMLSNMSIVQSKAVKASHELESAYYNVQNEQMSLL